MSAATPNTPVQSSEAWHVRTGARWWKWMQAAQVPCYNASLFCAFYLHASFGLIMLQAFIFDSDSKVKMVACRDRQNTHERNWNLPSEPPGYILGS